MEDGLNPSKEETLAAWAKRVRENREQAERFREGPERVDFYSPTASVFKADPLRTDEAALDILRAMARPNESWLDIGAGGGRYALPLARVVREVIAVEPSQAMRSILRQSMVEYGINKIRVIEERWPMKGPPVADVALVSHVGYDIEDIGPFLDAMEASARRLCVAVLLDTAPSTIPNPFWQRIHGESRIPLPALREFLILQLSRGRLCEVRLTTRKAVSYPNRERMLSFLRQQLFIEPGGEKDRLLEQLVKERAIEQEGRFGLSWKETALGIVSWAPAH
jgi:SAM-dependent methyltransferase